MENKLDPSAESGMRFCYWVPAFGTPGGPSNGFVASKIEQRTGWDLDYNVKLGKLAEENGIEFALTAARFSSAHLAAGQNEAVALSQFILANTTKLKVIIAALTGTWHPGVMAKMLSTTDYLSNGRVAINIITGWFAEEYRKFGIPWLEHDERYRMSEEFIQVLKGCWTTEHFTFKGDFFRINDYTLSPQPAKAPLIFQGGSSTAARRMAAQYSDFFFTNGAKPEVLKPQIDDVRAQAAKYGRRVRCGMNAFIIARDTEAEARETYKEIIRLADWDTVNQYAEQVKQAGKSSKDRIGLWTDSEMEDLVQYNNGFKPDMIGTPEQIASKIVDYEDEGLDLLLMGFLHFQEEVEYFGKKILPIVREMEAERRNSPGRRKKRAAQA